MDYVALVQLVGLLGIRLRYWAIIVVVIVVIIALGFVMRSRSV